VQAKWSHDIKDDPRVLGVHNYRGYLTFAQTSEPNSRSTQLFIHFGDNSRLDEEHFTPIGKVLSGMEFVDQLNQRHGEEPEQGLIQLQGNVYLKEKFPGLSYIKRADIKRL
jgi:cyclophilin family peptidyl-prolyl cis-trans isomerase